MTDEQLEAIKHFHRQTHEIRAYAEQAREDVFDLLVQVARLQDRIAKLEAIVSLACPKCDCGDFATVWGDDSDDYRCERHRSDEETDTELEWAAAVRALSDGFRKGSYTVTPERIKDAADKCAMKLRAFAGGEWYLQPERIDPATAYPSRSQMLRHALFMCRDILDLVDSGRLEKAFRWLGFLQGMLFTLHIATLEELKRMNMPAEET